MHVHHITLAALAALMVLPMACGGSSSPAAKTAPAPLVGTQDPVLSTHPSPHPDPVTTTMRPVRARPPQFGTDNDETSMSGAKPLDPCSLLTSADVRRTAGRISARHLGKQGPTCVYSLTAGKGRILTIAVQSAPLPSVARSRSTIRATVRGRPAYCIRRSPVTLLVRLDASRLLAVGAPCPIAARLAALALPRVSR